MKDRKKTKYPVEEEQLLQEPTEVYISSREDKNKLSGEMCADNDLKRSVTGELLLQRLRPRIKQLFE